MTSHPSQTPTDEELAQKAQGGDMSSFEKLIERYEIPLLRYILRISSFSREEAEEILQEVFLKIWKNLRGFDTKEKFSSWAYRIVHNRTISEFRKVSARGKEYEVNWNEDFMTNLPGKIDLPEELNQKLNAKQVHKALNLLAEKYRTVLVLNFLEEKSYGEISDILRIPPGTVATLLSRAKKSFREILIRNKISFS